MAIDIGTCIAQDFAAYVNSAFYVEHERVGKLEFRLLSISDTPHFKPQFVWAKRPPFSLFFASPQGYEVGQGTLTLHHKALGKMMVFLVPVGRVGGNSHDLTQPLLLQCSFN
ncbi:DUF6916 family protein [Ferrovibrio sp.]|uniref:DUF6916 family protein n=1 Tax=Ferrovibrio sp. TaxID=1917215 RepID=UPI003D2DDB2F